MWASKVRKMVRFDRGTSVHYAVRFPTYVSVSCAEAIADLESATSGHIQPTAPTSGGHMAADRTTYMSAVGALLWLAAGTRPDITFAVSMLARFSSNPGPVHMTALRHVLGYLSRTSQAILRLQPHDALFE